MPDKQERLLDAIADLHAETDNMAEAGFAVYDKDIRALLFDPSGRDADVWMRIYQAAGLEAMGWPFETWLDLDLLEMNQIPAIERGYDWVTATAALLTASTHQVQIDTLRTALSISADNKAQIDKAAAAMSRAEAKAAGKVGVTKERIGASKERKRALLEIR